jgi:adenosine kinase
MRTLICGSLAYDTIMVFQDRFKHHILPDKIHILNVSFLVPDMRREFGGCAGNIAYNLKLLGGEPVIMAAVGEDFGPYRERLERLGIDVSHVRLIPGTYTAQAFITTDLDDNQITAFHPGAMNHAHQNDVTQVRDVALAIVAPDGREGMLRHARGLHAAGIPFVFDPGQAMPLFDGRELTEFVDLADYVTVNDYEAELMQERTGLTLDALARRVKALVVTQGAQGSLILADGERVRIPCVPAARVVDPTGCGDAYRAGLLYGMAQGWNWEQSGRLAAYMGALKVASRGAQNHTLDRAHLRDWLQSELGLVWG